MLQLACLLCLSVVGMASNNVSIAQLWSLVPGGYCNYISHIHGYHYPYRAIHIHFCSPTIVAPQEGLPGLGSIDKAAQSMVDAGTALATALLKSVLDDYR